jgi:tRNA (guanine9-N1)-methyltransferase
MSSPSTVEPVGAPSPSADTADTAVPLSKNQQKKLRREAKLAVKKALYKEKNKAKQKAKRRQLAESGMVAERKQRSDFIAHEQKAPHATIVFDCAWTESLMPERDCRSLSQQLLRSYSLNRKTLLPFNVAVSSVEGKFEKRLQAMDGYMNWTHFSFRSDHFLQTYPLTDHNVIYLSSEGENDLTDIPSNAVIVIGAIIDRNHHKGLCATWAKEHGIPVFRLPIKDHVKLASSAVLTCNQVFEMLLQVVNGSSWADAVKDQVPLRKRQQEEEPAPSEVASQ